MGSASESKLFVTITLESIQQMLAPYRNTTFYIITAESGYCPACHSDLSSANITAPNSLLGHLRRSKKCIAKREERGVTLFGLKQPDSLLWGSVDDLTALDPRRFTDRDLWVNQVFPPMRPQQQSPVITSMSQWNARHSSDESYASSSPSPSSSSDDDYGSSSGYSSSGGSPTSAHFHQQYVSGDEFLYGTRRESNATISGKAYYNGQSRSPPAQYPMQTTYQSAPYAAPGLGMGIGAQYRAQQQGIAMQSQYMQPGYQMGYAPPANAYVPQQPWQGY